MKSLLSFLLVSLAFVCKSQENAVSKEPQFPGGHTALMDYMHLNFDWECAYLVHSEEVSSKIYLSFVVQVDGHISAIKVDKGINESMDQCCLKFIENMPKWIPGEDLNGNKVAHRIRFPITICLR